jgi:two-component system, cell cycle response regulator
MTFGPIEADFRGWRSVVGPTLFWVLAVALLVYDRVQGRLVGSLFWATLALIAGVFVWLVHSNHVRAETIARQRRGAIRDEVTGLFNRSKLQTDVASALASPDGRGVLILVELDGLQAQIDRSGYSAADELLQRVGRKLADGVASLKGSAYRVDGSQFAVLVPAADQTAGEIAMAATASLVDAEDGALIEVAHGEVMLPDDAPAPEGALQVATQRLAARKQRQRRSASRQAHAALFAVLSARRPELRDHLRDVSFRVLAVGRGLGVEDEQLDDIVRAAQLQDIGLLAVPEAVLENKGTLTEHERELIHRHPIEGERIISAAPGLAPVAALVRSSCERFDGSGYPDGLAGEAIPLGARIIAVCVAFAAMTSPRPYRAFPLSEEEALEELRRGGGTQFDPAVVEALAQDLAATE